MKTMFFAFLILISSQIFSQTIPFILLPSGHIVIKAKVEGLEGNFIFDTGAGINVFFNDFVSKFDKEPSSTNFMTGFRANGERLDIPLFQSKDIIFATEIFRNIPFSTIEMKMPGVDGLISLKMFEHTNITIDYNTLEITINSESPDSGSKALDIFVSTQVENTLDISTFMILNNDHQIKVLLDSGAGSNSFWFNDKIIKILNINTNTLKVAQNQSEINSEIKNKISRGKVDIIGNNFVKIYTPDVVFVQNLIYEGKTGIDWIGKKFMISIKDKKIYLLN